MTFQMTDFLLKLKGCNESDKSIYPLYVIWKKLDIVFYLELMTSKRKYWTKMY